MEAGGSVMKNSVWMDGGGHEAEELHLKATSSCLYVQLDGFSWFSF